MTFEARYSVTGTEIKNVTLYEACKALAGIPRAERNDHTHIRRDGRPVAFACDWRHQIVAMFGALPAERKLVQTWTFATMGA